MDDILDAINFSRYSQTTNVNVLTAAEIICLHQHIRLHKKLSLKINKKLADIKLEIRRVNWERLILRYNHHFQQEFWDGNDWKVLRLNNN